MISKKEVDAEVEKGLRRKKAIKILTRRELQVFILSGRAGDLAKVSVILGISKKTVSTHRMSILSKLQLENSYQVMEYCIRADMDTDEFMNKYI